MNIVFDVDDTLYDLMDPFRRTHEELYAPKTDTPCEQLFIQSRKYSDEAFYQWSRGLIDKTQEFHYRISKTYADAGICLTEKDTAYFNERYRYYQGKIQIFAGMADLLDCLKERKVRLAILTNGKQKDQGNKIHVLGLDAWFVQDHIFISEDLPAPKPDVRPYKCVEEKLQFKPEETWYVGDMLESDILGANRAGWHSIWFNHRRRSIDTGSTARPDYEVHSVTELREILTGIAKKSYGSSLSAIL